MLETASSHFKLKFWNFICLISMVFSGDESMIRSKQFSDNSLI